MNHQILETGTVPSAPVYTNKYRSREKGKSLSGLLWIIWIWKIKDFSIASGPLAWDFEGLLDSINDALANLWLSTNGQSTEKNDTNSWFVIEIMFCQTAKETRTILHRESNHRKKLLNPYHIAYACTCIFVLPLWPPWAHPIILMLSFYTMTPSCSCHPCLSPLISTGEWSTMHCKLNSPNLSLSS